MNVNDWLLLYCIIILNIIFQTIAIELEVFGQKDPGGRCTWSHEGPILNYLNLIDC